jgi:hypothetical protein
MGRVELATSSAVARSGEVDALHGIESGSRLLNDACTGRLDVRECGAQPQSGGKADRGCHTAAKHDGQGAAQEDPPGGSIHL